MFTFKFNIGDELEDRYGNLFTVNGCDNFSGNYYLMDNKTHVNVSLQIPYVENQFKLFTNQKHRLTMKFTVGEQLLDSSNFKIYRVMVLNPISKSYQLEDTTNGSIHCVDQSVAESSLSSMGIPIGMPYPNYGNLSSPGPAPIPMPLQSLPSGPLMNQTSTGGWSGTIKLDMTDPIPSKPSCKHDWRDSRSEGSTKWCAMCGDRK